MDFTYPVPGNQQQFTTGYPKAALPAEAEYTVEDLLNASVKDYSTAGDVDSMEVNAAPGGLYQPAQRLAVGVAAAAEIQLHQRPPCYSVGAHPSTFFNGAGTGTEEMLLSAWSALQPLGQVVVVDAAHTIPPPAVNAGLAHPQPDPYSVGYSTCPSTTTDMGTSSPDLEVNAPAGLPQSGSGGGGALTEAPGSCKRKKVAGDSSCQRPAPEFNSVELEAGFIQSDKTPDGSTPSEIIRFLKRERYQDELYGKKLNWSQAQEDQVAPKAVQRYVTTAEMKPDQKTHDLGYRKEKQVEPVLDDYGNGALGWSCFYAGLKRTWQFETCDGTKTNWFMDEYIPLSIWGIDRYMEGLRYRVVYQQGKQVPGEPTSRQVAHVKYRIREPDDPKVVKGESPAWEHFIKIYDRLPNLVGAKVVYAACRNCPAVLRAATENGTSSLLTHCKRTCQRKHLQPSASK